MKILKISISQLETDKGKGNSRFFEFKSSKFSAAQIKRKMDLLNKLILFTIKQTYIDLYKNNNTLNLLSQLLIKFIFDKVISFSKNETNKNNKILKEIKNIIEIKRKKYITLINTDEIFTEGFNISILDKIDKQKISRLKIRQQDDKTYIENIENIENITNDLEDLEKKLFDENIVEDTPEEFINNIMFFFTIDEYKVNFDPNKKTLCNVFINKLISKIKNYYKNKLETEFTELNNKHKIQLDELGLNISPDELDNDEELSDKLENEIIKLNDHKYTLFTTINTEMEKLNKLINYVKPEEEENKSNLLINMINKYIIQNKKIPFKVEYIKTLNDYEKHKTDLFEMLSTVKSDTEQEQTNENKENDAKNNEEDTVHKFIKQMTELGDKSDTSTENINMAITKLQLMYLIKDENYLKLIGTYTLVTDLYYKLIELEKINRLPITRKPAILLLIAKLFINNLVDNNVSVEEDETNQDEEEVNFLGLYKTDSNTPTLKKKKDQSTKQIKSKLFDNINYKNIDDPGIKNKKSVVFGVESGSIMK